jgi:hypothetical protein
MRFLGVGGQMNAQVQGVDKARQLYASASRQARQRHDEREKRLKVSQELVVGGDHLTPLALGQRDIEAIV